MKTVTVNVTADDIRNGEPGQPRSCPIAHALQRTVLRGPLLVYPVMGIEDDYERRLARLSPAAEDFVQEFDRITPPRTRREVRPRTFRFQLTDAGQERASAPGRWGAA